MWKTVSLSKFGKADANPMKGPTEANGSSENGNPLDKKVPYREAIESYMPCFWHQT